jgi:hypothetical protein
MIWCCCAAIKAWTKSALLLGALFQRCIHFCSHPNGVVFWCVGELSSPTDVQLCTAVVYKLEA